MIPDAPQITGLILAGGRGSRMGGADKGWQMYDGNPLIAQALARLQPQVGALMISANRNLEQYRRLGLPVWSDDVAQFGEYAGPLAGLYSGLAHCRTPYLVCVPCDAPALPADLVARLAQALYKQQADLAVAAAGTGSQRHVHRVCALMKANLAENLASFLRTGKTKVGAWHASLNTVEVDFDDDAAFQNINTLEELRHGTK